MEFMVIPSKMWMRKDDNGNMRSLAPLTLREIKDEIGNVEVEMIKDQGSRKS